MAVRYSAPVPGRGTGGISTSGPENFNTKVEHPHYFGNKEGGKYHPYNNGIVVRVRSKASRKTTRHPPKF